LGTPVFQATTDFDEVFADFIVFRVNVDHNDQLIVFDFQIGDDLPGINLSCLLYPCFVRSGVGLSIHVTSS